MKRLFFAVCALAVMGSCGESCPECSHPVMMMRLRPTNTDTDENWKATFDMIRENPGCCDEVWFSTGMGYLPEDWHRDKVSRMSKAMEQLRGIGISSSLQFQMTIGHGDKFGYGNEHLFSEMTWTGWTGSTGVESRFCSCPRHPDFIAHIRTVAGMYASLHPGYIWVDDDLRYDNHKPATLDSHIGCWCDDCIGEFNRRTSGKWTRETLAAALDRDAVLNDRWHSYCVDALCNVAGVISEEVHRVSPETKMGLQGKKEDFVVDHVSQLLAVMAEKTGNSVGYRPGTGARFDMDGASGQIVKSMASARFIRLAGNPSHVDLWCPEIETWPRVYGSRTGQGVLVEAFASLAYGLNSVSMFIMAADMEAPDLYSSSLLKPISEGSDVLYRYAAMNEGTFVAGYESEASCETLYEFARTGIPVLPGVGKSLGTVSEEEIAGVVIPKTLSADIQKLREGHTAPSVCCSPFVGLLIPRVTDFMTLKTVGVMNTRIDSQSSIRIRLSGIEDSSTYAIWRELKKKPVRIPLESAPSGESYVVIPEISAWSAGFLSFE